MSSVHNALRRGPWTRAAQGILGDSREGGGIERLGESMMPTIDLWSPARPEWQLYRQEQGIYLHVFAPAVAGEFSCAVFEPPLVGNAVLVIEELVIGCANQVLLGYDIRPAGSVASVNKDFIDVRGRATQAARPRSNCYLDSNVGSAVTGPFMRFTPTAANVSLALTRPWVLATNLQPAVNQHVLIVESGTANVAMTVTAFGYERELLPSEVS